MKLFASSLYPLVFYTFCATRAWINFYFLEWQNHKFLKKFLEKRDFPNNLKLTNVWFSALSQAKKKIVPRFVSCFDDQNMKSKVCCHKFLFSALNRSLSIGMVATREYVKHSIIVIPSIQAVTSKSIKASSQILVSSC